MAVPLLAPLTLAAAAVAPQAPPLWVVERGAYTCAVKRQGDGGPASLEVSSVPGSDTFVLRIAGVPTPQPLPQSFALRLSPGGAAELHYFRTPPVPAVGIELFSTDPAFLDRLGRARGATLLGDGRPLAELALAGIPAGTGALRACLDESLRRWGVDPRSRAALSRQPRPAGGSVARWFRAGDYPASALRNDETGSVVMRLAVAADGRTESCDVVVGAGSAALDQRSCEVILERSRFDPALDAEGRPVAAKLIARVVWRLEL